MYQVALKPSAHIIPCNPDETVLEAALRAGLVIPYGCRDGACGSCKGKLVSGEIDYGTYAATALTAEEKAAGSALFCRAKPKSDLVVECRDVRGASDIQIKTLPVRVQKIDKLAPDVVVLQLKLPANEKFRFLAGQYVDLLLKDGKRRSYSMANPPHASDFIELHVRHTPGGLFTEQVFNAMQEKAILRFEGPLGGFYLREDSDKPIVLLASGTGFAPIKSVIEYAFNKGIARPITLYWGGRRPRDLYMHTLAEEWQAGHPNFKYVPVISDATEEDGWTGRSGFVHKAVMQDFPDLSGHQVYACGAPVVVNSAHSEFTAQCNLPESEFFADAFTTAADLAKTLKNTG